MTFQRMLYTKGLWVLIKTIGLSSWKCDSEYRIYVCGILTYKAGGNQVLAYHAGR